MADYKQVKMSKLKLKGVSVSKKKKKVKLKSFKHDEIKQTDDFVSHNGWWSITSFDMLNGGTVALKLYNNSFVFAVDNGTLCLGSKGSTSNEIPAQEEMFTMIKVTENKVAFKSGYGKYISVNARGDILARSDAVGPQEQLEVVIEGKEIALQGHNGYFITVNDEGVLKSLSQTAKEKEIITLLTNASRHEKKKVTEDSTINVRQCEINFVKQFQSFPDRKLRLHQGPESSLEKAKSAGKLHEAMLDRREKMKADRYCK